MDCNAPFCNQNGVKPDAMYGLSPCPGDINFLGAPASRRRVEWNSLELAAGTPALPGKVRSIPPSRFAKPVLKCPICSLRKVALSVHGWNNSSLAFLLKSCRN